MYEHLVIFVAKKTNEIPENLNTIEINTHAHMIQKLNSVLNIFTSMYIWFPDYCKTRKFVSFGVHSVTTKFSLQSIQTLKRFHGKVCFLYAMVAVVIVLITSLLYYLL